MTYGKTSSFVANTKKKKHAPTSTHPPHQTPYLVWKLLLLNGMVMTTFPPPTLPDIPRSNEPPNVKMITPMSLSSHFAHLLMHPVMMSHPVSSSIGKEIILQ
jgi:hypothetical protein